MKLKKHKTLSLIALIILSACKEKVEEKEVVLRPVKYEIVETSSEQSLRTFSGTVKAADEIELSFRANGIITELNAKVGQQVKKGDLIARIKVIPDDINLSNARTNVEKARIALEESGIEKDRREMEITNRLEIK